MPEPDRWSAVLLGVGLLSPGRFVLALCRSLMLLRFAAVHLGVILKAALRVTFGVLARGLRALTLEVRSRGRVRRPLPKARRPILVAAHVYPTLAPLTGGRAFQRTKGTLRAHATPLAAIARGPELAGPRRGVHARGGKALELRLPSDAPIAWSKRRYGRPTARRGRSGRLCVEPATACASSPFVARPRLIGIADGQRGEQRNFHARVEQVRRSDPSPSDEDRVDQRQ